MVKDGIVNVRVSKKIREEAEKTLMRYGLSLSDGVNMFLYQVISHGGLPFELKPTDETLQAVQEMKEGRYSRIDNIDELFL
jgi:DNA-damage-inducible protein J